MLSVDIDVGSILGRTLGKSLGSVLGSSLGWMLGDSLRIWLGAPDALVVFCTDVTFVDVMFDGAGEE